MLCCPARVSSRVFPRHCATGGGQGPVGRGIRGDPTGEFHKGFQGRPRIPLKGNFSKTKMSVTPEVLLKPLDFRTCIRTFDMTIVRMPHSSR